MKKVFVFIALLIVVLICVPVFADSLSDEADMPSRASRRIYVVSSYNMVYNCPVKQRTVTVNLMSASGPDIVDVKLQYKDRDIDAWRDTSTHSITMDDDSNAAVFTLPYATYYRVYAKKATGSEGYCTFGISASAY